MMKKQKLKSVQQCTTFGRGSTLIDPSNIFLDESGFWIDESGNYILDESGNKIHRGYVQVSGGTDTYNMGGTPSFNVTASWGSGNFSLPLDNHGGYPIVPFSFNVNSCDASSDFGYSDLGIIWLNHLRAQISFSYYFKEGTHLSHGIATGSFYIPYTVIYE